MSEPTEAAVGESYAAEQAPEGSAPQTVAAEVAPGKSETSEATEDGTLLGGTTEGESQETEGSENSYAELALPEDSALSADHLDSVREFAAEHELPAEVAEQILARDEALIAAKTEADRQAWDTQAQEGMDEVTRDPEIGGEKLPESKALADAALAAFWPADFRQSLINSRLINNAVFFRGLVKAGAKVAESSHLADGGPAAERSGPSLSSWFANSPEMANYGSGSG